MGSSSSRAAGEDPRSPRHPPEDRAATIARLPEGSARRSRRSGPGRRRSTTPATRSRPKPRTIGVGESSRARKPAAVARQAVAIVGPPLSAAAPRRLGATLPRRRPPRRSGPGTGSRSRPRARSGSAGPRSRPSSGSRRTSSSRPKTIAAAARARASGSSRRRERKTSSRVSAITTRATAKRTSSASFSAAREAVDDDRRAGDDVAAASQLEARGRPCRFSAQALRGVVSATAVFDQAASPGAVRSR